MEKLYSLKDVAKLLKIRSHRVGYAVSSGAVKEPALRLANKRIFSTEDVRRLADHFGKTLES
jgi:hypothetical protein